MKTDPVFASYLANIKTKTGKTPADFKAIAKKKGLLRPGVKAGEIVAWLKKDFDLAMGTRWRSTPCSSLRSKKRNSRGGP